MQTQEADSLQLIQKTVTVEKGKQTKLCLEMTEMYSEHVKMDQDL